MELLFTRFATTNMDELDELRQFICLLLNKLLGGEQTFLIAIHIFQIEYIPNGTFLSYYSDVCVIFCFLPCLIYRK